MGYFQITILGLSEPNQTILITAIATLITAWAMVIKSKISEKTKRTNEGNMSANIEQDKQTEEKTCKGISRINTIRSNRRNRKLYNKSKRTRQ